MSGHTLGRDYNRTRHARGRQRPRVTWRNIAFNKGLKKVEILENTCKYVKLRTSSEYYRKISIPATYVRMSQDK